MHLCSIDWGVHLPSIYMHCPRYSSGFSSMQGICAQLTGEDLCWIALCYANIFGVAVCKASVLNWLGRTSWLHCAMLIYLVKQYSMHLCSIDWGSICLLYICIILDLARGVAVCKASVLYWLGRATWSGMVFKASVLNWLGRTYAQLHCAMLIYVVYW